MYDDIALFLEIIKHGSFSATARYLDMPAATVTRRLQKLEKQLGVQLLNRSSRQVTLTQDGQTHYDAYRQVFEELEKVHKGLSRATHELKGPLKVLAPTNISIGLFQPMWSAFIQQYPDIQLELVLNNSIADLLTSKADIALRIGPQQDSDLHQRCLGVITTQLVASPQYVAEHGAPNTIDELNEHRLIGATALSNWLLTKKGSEETRHFQPNFSTLANDLNLVCQLARDGLGIALLPRSETIQQLKDECLVPILPQWHGPARDMYLVWPSGQLLNSKAKCLKDFILDYIDNEFDQTHPL